MKMRYWLTAAILAGLGIFCYNFVYGYQFTGIILCGLAVVRLAFGILNMCTSKIFSIVFSIAFCVGILAMIVTGVWIVTNMSGSEDPQAEYAVVLGAGVNGSEPSKSLSERIDAAEEYAKAHPKSILILSGGKSEEDTISEAQCMYQELTARGISGKRLLKEERASNTEENLTYAMETISAHRGSKPTEIVVITSEYHIPRATLIADRLGIKVLGYPAETENFLYFCNMFVREIFAVWKEVL